MNRLNGCITAWALWMTLCTVGADPGPQRVQAASVIVVVGAPGEKEFAASFEGWAELWVGTARKAGASVTVIGLQEPNATNDLAEVKCALEKEEKETSSELWLVLIGHGTFDGKQAKFNLRGPDLSANELSAWLEPFQRPLAIIDASSSSSPFLKLLSAKGRVVVTATRSGYEQNYARFGQFFAAAISDTKADLDKDGQVSILEAFLMAAHEVAAFYKTEGRLATEHPLLDDNGDGLGTPPDWFRGVRATKKPAEGEALDGLRAHQFHLLRSEEELKLSPASRLRRNELEAQIEALRQRKDQLPEDDYYTQLEKVLLELARLYADAEHSDQPVQ